MNGWNQERAQLRLLLVRLGRSTAPAYLSPWFPTRKPGANNLGLALSRYRPADKPYLTVAFRIVDVPEESASGLARRCGSGAPNSQ